MLGYTACIYPSSYITDLGSDLPTPFHMVLVTLSQDKKLHPKDNCKKAGMLGTILAVAFKASGPAGGGFSDSPLTSTSLIWTAILLQNVVVFHCSCLKPLCCSLAHPSCRCKDGLSK